MEKGQERKQAEDRYTKKNLMRQLSDMGLSGEETILIHSSMKAIGQVEGGAETVLDVWMDFFDRGLLLLPTHTWKTVNEDRPVFDMAREEACVGILPNLFRRREGVVRSVHPTHSVAGYGRNAGEYLAGEEMCTTPCAPGGCYDRLRYVGGKILLVGVGHERNTYIHSVEEVLNVPNRLAAKPMKLQILMEDGTEKTVYMRKHYNPEHPHISENFVKLTQAFLDCGAAENVRFGSADCVLCDAGKIFEVTRHVLAPDPECLLTGGEIPGERWTDF